MEDYPKTIEEFEARFSSEEACREYLIQLRWPEGFRCPRCQHSKLSGDNYFYPSATTILTD